MDWKQDFIGRVLSGVPAGPYRRRAEAELRDHLESQCRALTEAGWALDEARAEAVRTMGEPKTLKLEYEAAWLRTPAGRIKRTVGVLGSVAAGCVVMGALYIATAIVLSMAGFTYDGVYPARASFPLLGDDKLPLAIFGSALFLLPFTLGAWFLRFCFLRESRPVGLMTAGLLAAWAGEKVVIIGLSALIYQMPLGLDLLTRISRGGDVTGPWFTPAYIVLTFAGCILLGQLFGRMPVGENKRQTV